MKNSSSYLALGIVALTVTLFPVVMRLNSLALSTFTLRLHAALDTGLTSCALEAGNGYDLAALGVELPFVVQSVTVYAQRFGGESSGTVNVNVYSDDDFNPTNGAALIASPGSVSVRGSSPTAYTLSTGDVRVTQPYLYVIATFDTPVVINASHVGSPGGSSFSSGCDETGLESLTHTVGSDTARLAIEVSGYSEIVEAIVTVTPTPTPTIETTIEVTADVAAEMTLEVTEAAPMTATLTPTETPTFTPEATIEVTAEVTDEAEMPSTIVVSPTVEPSVTSEPTPTHASETTEEPAPQPPQPEATLTIEAEATEAVDG